VDRFTLRLGPGAGGDSVRAEIERRAYGVEAYASSTVAAATSETFRVISRFHRALAGITIVGSGVFLLCLVVLKVGERRREGAAMREIGLSRRTLFLWAFTETCVMAVVGTAAGLVLGSAGAALINAYFQRVYGTSLAFARVTPDLAVEVAAIGLVLGAGIGLWAGRRMVRTAPARLREP
jgi:putative ABC transport system permease protein